MMIRPTKHYRLTLTLPLEDCGEAFGALRQMPWFDDACVELTQVFEDDETSPEPRAIRDERSGVEPRALAREEAFNASQLSGEARMADRLVTKDAAKAVFEACWPERSRDLKRRHHRETFLTAARQLRVPPDRAEKALHWLLNNGSVKRSRVKGEYLPGEESRLYLELLEAATAPATEPSNSTD